MKLRSRIALLLAFVATVVAIPMGFSSWVFGSKDASTSISKSTDYVCYIDENMEANRYPTIESALDKAVSGNSVYVVPGNSGTIRYISEDCEIRSGVTLIMPYEGTKYNVEASEKKATTDRLTDFEADTYVKGTVIISPGVTLTINGTFIVGGESAYGSDTGITGYISGPHTKLILKEGTKDDPTNIVVNKSGKLYSFGRILRDSNASGYAIENTTSKIEVIGGEVRAVALIYNWPGGTKAASLVGNPPVFPFTDFDVHNISVPIIFSKNAIFYANVRMEEVSSYIYEWLKIVSPDENSLVHVSDESVVKFDYYSKNQYQKTTYSITNHSTHIQLIKGNASISYILLEMSFSLLIFQQKITVDSRKMSVPLPGTFHIEIGDGINNANATCNYSFNFSSGGRFTVNRNASLHLDSAINSSGCTNPGIVFFDGSHFVNNGTVYINGKSAGLVKSSMNNSLLVTEDIEVLDETTQYTSGGERKQVSAIYPSFERTLRGNIEGTVGNFDSNSTYAYNGQYWQKKVSRKITFSEQKIGQGTFAKPSFTVDVLRSGASEAESYNFDNFETDPFLNLFEGDKFTISEATNIDSFKINGNNLSVGDGDYVTVNSSDITVEFYTHLESAEIHIQSVTIMCDGSSSDLEKEGAYTYKLSLSYIPNAFNINYIKKITWTLDKSKDSNSAFSSVSAPAEGKTESFNVTSSDKTGTLVVNVTVEDIYGTKKTDDISLINTKKPGGCLVEGTLVTMSDGTKLPVEQLKEGDAVKVFDHSTSKLTTSIVARDTHNDEQAIQIDVMNLKFSDGTISRVAVDHGYFSREENKYVYIDANNYEEYLGKEFVIFDDNGDVDYVTLDEVKITNENVRIFAPITYKHLNLIADDLLTISGGLEGIFNYFDLDENMMIDRDKMNQDIERYGLYTYEEWAEYLTPVQFDAFNVKYLKVSVGKGLVTKERLIEYIKMYLY